MQSYPRGPRLTVRTKSKANRAVPLRTCPLFKIPSDKSFFSDSNSESLKCLNHKDEQVVAVCILIICCSYYRLLSTMDTKLLDKLCWKGFEPQNAAVGINQLSHHVVIKYFYFTVPLYLFLQINRGKYFKEGNF